MKSEVIRYNLKRRAAGGVIAVLRTVFFLGIAFYILYPLFSKAMLALMSQEDIYDVTVSIVPKHWTFENVKLVLKVLKYPTAFFNSLTLSILVTVLQITSGILVGYGFGRFDFPFKKLFFALGIFTLVVPPQILILPLYLNYGHFDILGIIGLITGGKLNLINTYFPFILSSLFCTGTKGMLFVFMFRQYFRGMPKEIEEAARVDGAGEIRTFLQIMAPSSRPVMVCVALLSFVWQWNDILYTGWYMRGFNVLSVNLSALTESVKPYIQQVSGTTTITPAYSAMLNGTGIILIILPLIVLYMFLQRYFIKSVERSGIVG